MKNKDVKIAFVTRFPFSKKSYSGTHFSIYMSLSKQYEFVDWIGPLKIHLVLKLYLNFIKVYNLVFKSRQINVQKNKFLSKSYGKELNKKLKNKKYNLIFAPTASTEIAYLKTNIPICFSSDTSFSQHFNYYNPTIKLTNNSYKVSDLIERKAIHNSKIIVYSSNWAANHAINYYDFCKNNVYVVEYGANLDFIPKKINLQKKFTGKIKILFLGVDWKRKRGDLVLESFRILRGKGFDVELTICGCVPSDNVYDSRIKIIPFLNKHNKKDNERFKQLFYESHLLFLPTSADCTPIVFCEANAFGIPVISTNTGGITSIIEDGVNGYALPENSIAIDYVEKIQYLLNNRNEMAQMALSSRKKYEDVFNWTIWGEKMKSILTKTLKM